MFNTITLILSDEEETHFIAVRAKRFLWFTYKVYYLTEAGKWSRDFESVYKTTSAESVTDHLIRFYPNTRC